MSWVAVGTVAVSAVAGGVNAASQAGASKDAQRAQYYAQAASMQKFKKYRDQLLKGEYLGSYGLEDVFGSRPEAELYEPVNLDSSLVASIMGNAGAGGDIASLVSGTNAINRAEDLGRITSLLPEFTKTLGSYEGATQSLINGQLPFEDVLGIVSNQAELGASLGTPGTRTNATLKDLGLSRLNATQQGGQMWQSLLGALNTSVNPVGNQFLAQGNYLTPQNRLSADLSQAGLDQASRQSAAFLAASPNPGPQNLWLSELQQQQAMAGVQGTAAAAPSASSAGWSGAGMGAMNGLLSYFGGIGGAGSALGGGLATMFGGSGNVTGNHTASQRPY
jgi:hypothetical protein